MRDIADAAARLAQVACGANHSGAVTGGQAGEGTVFLWGNGSNFRLGNSDTQEQETPQQVRAMHAAHPGIPMPFSLYTPHIQVELELLLFCRFLPAVVVSLFKFTLR